MPTRAPQPPRLTARPPPHTGRPAAGAVSGEVALAFMPPRLWEQALRRAGSCAGPVLDSVQSLPGLRVSGPRPSPFN